MRLPPKFVEKMKKILKEDYVGFSESYEAPRFQGIRINTLKISVDEFKKISPFELTPIPWCHEGFYVDIKERPGKHPYYHAGLYYIQEPSAMAPVEVLNPKQGEKVLDLCAAPGGKSVQIAGKLQDEGVLITNDLNMNRAKALVKNMELYGVKNAIVMNEDAKKLKKYFTGYFDKILVDAPCSGEGMFRKDSEMIKSWEKHDDNYYAPIQTEILTHIDVMLKGQGNLLYSTCTFSPEENECIIEGFLNDHEEYHIENTPYRAYFSEGIPMIDEQLKNEELKKCARLWPHRLKGEGHFLAYLKKDREQKNESFKSSNNPSLPKEFNNFVKENLKVSLHGQFEMYGQNLHLIPKDLPAMKGLKILRSGWLLGTFKKNRFEPSHALAMGIDKNQCRRVINFNKEDQNVVKYLKGETLTIGGEKGWTLVCVDGFNLGWAKQTGTMLKNCYPKAWRWID